MMNRKLVAALNSALLVLFCIILAGPNSVNAEQKDPVRELSNVSVIGVEKFEEPTQHHPQDFEMVQYFPNLIEGLNPEGLPLTKPEGGSFFKPPDKGLRFITSTPVRKSLDNFSYNISYPVRLVSLLLQGEVVKTGEETAHFLVNSTVGLAGLFDPGSRWGIPTYHEDGRLAFGGRGNGPGYYLFPELRRSTVMSLD